MGKHDIAEPKASTKSQVLRILREELPYLRERFGVTRIALYGSFARGEPKEKSDVDLLVELSHPLGLEFVDLADYLEQKLGRKVDIATFNTFRLAGRNERRKTIVQHIERDIIDVEAATR